jgi:tetratricopeptide (TPR) repeat protein
MAEEFEKITDEMIRLAREGEEQFLKEGKSDKHAKRGVKLIQKEKYEEAERELVKASQKSPDNWHVWYHLGMVYRHHVRMDEALESFQKAAALQNIDTYHRDAAKIKAMMVASVLDDVPKAMELAQRLMQNKEYEYAIRAMDIALRKAPELDKVAEETADVLGTRRVEPAVLQNKAYCLTQLGRTDEALEIYERIIQIDPKDYFAYLALGALLHGRGREEEAFSYLDKGVELKPEDARGWFFYGDLLIKARRSDEAIWKIRKGLELDSGNPGALYNMARALEDVGRRREALQALEMAFSADISFRQRVLSDEKFLRMTNDSDFLSLMRRYSS